MELKVKDYENWLRNRTPHDELDAAVNRQRLQEINNEIMHNANVSEMPLFARHAWFTVVFFDENGEEIFP